MLIWFDDYTAWLWVKARSVQRWRYATSPPMIIERLVLQPLYIGWAAPVGLRLFRLQQLLELSRFSPELCSDEDGVIETICLHCHTALCVVRDQGWRVARRGS